MSICSHSPHNRDSPGTVPSRQAGKAGTVPEIPKRTLKERNPVIQLDPLIPLSYNEETYFKTKMRILIYGSGAVGLGLGSALIKSGHPLSFLARKDTVLALKRHGLIRTGIFGNFKVSPDRFFCDTSLGKLPHLPFDFILVTTKSFDSFFAAKDLSRSPFLFNKKTKIILCQNGWGNAEVFSQFFPRQKIYNARVITGFVRPQPHKVIVTVHADSILIGSLYQKGTSDLQEICAAIRKGDLPCQASPDIQKDLWAKMLYNCALNPLGAILNVPYGILGKYEETRCLMNDIIGEVFEVMKKGGYKTHWRSPQAYRKVFYARFLPSTASHESSTLQDIKAKKKTEIDALNGIIVRLAKQLKVNVPTNLFVYRMVKFIEKRNLTR